MTVYYEGANWRFEEVRPPEAASEFESLSMEKIPFGKTGLSVSRLGFGGAPIGLLETERARVADILNLLLDQGVNLIDTAACYAGSEAAIGEAVAHRRDEYFLVSKCGHKVAGVDAEEWTADFDVVETSINICDQANISAVLPDRRSSRVGVIAKRPMANAAWRSDLPGFYADYAKPYRNRFGRMNLSAAGLGFGGEPADVWPEIALRFTFAFADVGIAGTTNPRNAEANIAVANKGPLPPEAVATIREAFQRAEGASSERWQGLT